MSHAAHVVLLLDFFVLYLILKKQLNALRLDDAAFYEEFGRQKNQA